MMERDDSSLPLYPIEQWQNTSQSSPASLAPPSPPTTPSSSSSSSPSSCHIDESYKYIFLPLCYSVTFLLSLVLNSIILHRSFCGGGHRGGGGRAKRWTPSLTYMVNLATTDLMYGLSLPFLIASYAMRDRWVFGDPVCRLVRFLFYFNLYCSLAFLACISLHRYLGVCHPLRSLASGGPRRAVKGVCLLVWAVVFALTSPIFRFARAGRNREGNTVCWDDAPDWELRDYVPYGITLHVLLFCLPFGVIGWCYSRVARTIFRSLGEEGGGGGGDGGLPSSSSPQPPPSHSFLSLRRRRQSLRTVVTITLLLALCFLPFHVTRTVFLLLKGSAWGADCRTVALVSICYKLTRPLASFNAWLNALLYFLTKGRGGAARGGARREGGARRLEVLQQQQQQQQDPEMKSAPPADSGFKTLH